MADAILANIDPANDAIDEITLSQAGKGDPAKSGFFLNIKLKDDFIQARIKTLNFCDTVKMLDNPVEGAQEESKDPTEKKQRVLVDFSSPNIAKDMHVGHLRSTIQGDSICRIFEFLGNEVLRVNHVGDWGTQFGMLITELDDAFPNWINECPEISDLQSFYQNSKKRFDGEPEFKKKSQETVVKLQSGDEHCKKAWELLCDISRKNFDQIYERLNVKLDEYGESYYNPMLKPLIEELQAKGIAVEDNGAVCIFIPKQKVPVMIQKSDGGFNYDTTDLAALRHRIETLKCDRIVYVTDIGQ
jgi:arginyl-tRNA synthetase